METEATVELVARQHNMVSMVRPYLNCKLKTMHPKDSDINKCTRKFLMEVSRWKSSKKWNFSERRQM